MGFKEKGKRKEERGKKGKRICTSFKGVERRKVRRIHATGYLRHRQNECEGSDARMQG